MYEPLGTGKRPETLSTPPQTYFQEVSIMTQGKDFWDVIDAAFPDSKVVDVAVLEKVVKEDGVALAGVHLEVGLGEGSLATGLRRLLAGREKKQAERKGGKGKGESVKRKA